MIEKILLPDKNWMGEKLDSSSSFAPYIPYNIGNNKPVELLKFIEIIEKHIGEKAIKNLLPMQASDVFETYSDVDDLINAVAFKSSTSIEDGIEKFVNWFKNYYKY